MIKIERDNLEFLAKRHYFDYFIEKNYLVKLEKIKENETDSLQKKFFESIYKHIEDIIMGRPCVLHEKIQTLKHHHPEMMKRLEDYHLWRIKWKENKKVQRALAKAVKEGSSDLHKLKEREKKIKEIISLSETQVGEMKGFFDKIKGIFNYNTFRDNNGVNMEGKRTWGAYELVKQLKVGVCPYCNRQFITVFEPNEGEEGRTRPQLDHFYNQSKFPFLSVSFFNLIPSCYVCNSNLKSDHEFSIETHIHPYENSFEDLVQFTVEFNDDKDNTDYLKVWDSNTDMFSIDFKVNELKRRQYSSEEYETLYRKIEENRKVFQLKDLYNTHKDYVGEIIVKSRTYNDDKINSLCKEFPELFSTKEDLVRLVYSNYVDSSQFDKRVLAKLTRDITEEFGIKYI